MNHVVCRCEDVTLQDIDDAIDAGVCTAQEIKFQTRAGMGFCQGRVCRTEVERLLEGAGVSAEEYGSSMTVRQPVRPIALGDLADAAARRGDAE